MEPLKCEYWNCPNIIDEKYHFDFIDDDRVYVHCTLLCLMESIKMNTQTKKYERKEAWKIN